MRSRLASRQDIRRKISTLISSRPVRGFDVRECIGHEPRGCSAGENKFAIAGTFKGWLYLLPVQIRERSARIYFIFVSAAISSLPSAVLIVNCTCSPLLAGIVAEMRFPVFGSAYTASLNNTASPRFNIKRNGVAGSILKNCRFTLAPSAEKLIRMFSFACVTLLMPTVGL